MVKIKRSITRFVGLHRWAALLVAGALLTPGMLLADSNEEYEQGAKQYKEGDMAGAIAPLRKAVSAGNVKAMVMLAEILDYSEFNEDAVELYRKAADRGDPGGMFGLGSMMATGEGTKRDPAAARAWIEKAAKLGHTQAIRVMAQAYLKGELGLAEKDRDTPEALHWVELAAKDNFLPAVDALADAYRTGGILGVSANAALSEQFVAQGNKIRQIEPTSKSKKKKHSVASSQPAKVESVE